MLCEGLCRLDSTRLVLMFNDPAENGDSAVVVWSDDCLRQYLGPERGPCSANAATIDVLKPQ